MFASKYSPQFSLLWDWIVMSLALPKKQILICVWTCKHTAQHILWKHQNHSQPLPGKTNQATLETPKNRVMYTSSYIINPIKELPHKTITLLPWGQRLCEQVCKIHMRIDIGSSPFVSCAPFSHKMERQTIHLLFQSRRRYRGVHQNRFVVAIGKRWLITRYAEHS